MRNHISIKIYTQTLPKLRLLAAVTGKRMTVLIDEWASAELAQRGLYDSHGDSPARDGEHGGRDERGQQDG